jgi:2-polyprenyl-3-methyl-5-hydroxy-6-metoxy-1,4-benzoquinol methylase
MQIGPITKCQCCQAAPLESILFVGYLPPVNTMPKVGQPLEEQPGYPLELVRCPSCTLAQINFVVRPDILFPPDYPYTTGTTRILRENFSQLAEEATGLLGLKTSQLVVDIGSNDGTLLSNFHKRGHPVLGIEPTDKSKLANAAGIRSWNCFFNGDCAGQVTREIGRPALVTAANVFAHIPDPVGIVAAIAEMTGDDGVFINESHYFLSLVETLQYDTIYHEHLRYYSLKSMTHLLATAGLRVFNVKPIPTHGGSIRVYASRNKKFVPNESVSRQIEAEEKFGLCTRPRLQRFAREVFQSKADLLALLGQVRQQGHRVFAIGAPSRASTLINYCGLDRSLVDAVMEVGGSHKIGKFMPGCDIPVENEERLYREQPEYALLFSWHIAGELIPNLVKRGFKGDFIVPLPNPRIVRSPSKS